MQEVPFWRQPGEPAPTTAAVHVVPYHRMAERCEMDANLMRSPRVQVRAQEVAAAKSRKPDEISPRGLPGIDDRHTLSVSRMSCDWLIHCQGIGIEVAPGHCRVLARDSARGDRGAQPPMSDVALGDDKEAGCLLIQPVNDPGPVRPAALGQVTTASHESVDEGPRPVAGSRMNHHPCRFIDDEKVVILVYNSDGDRLPHHFAALWLGHCYLNDVSGNGAVRCLFVCAVHGDAAGRDEGRPVRSGCAESLGNNQVQPTAGELAGGKSLRRRQPPPLAQPLGLAATGPSQAEPLRQ